MQAFSTFWAFMNRADFAISPFTNALSPRISALDSCSGAFS
jgi:hypothetical protein